jgi:hypothetical protein
MAIAGILGTGAIAWELLGFLVSKHATAKRGKLVFALRQLLPLRWAQSDKNLTGDRARDDRNTSRHQVCLDHFSA